MRCRTRVVRVADNGDFGFLVNPEGSRARKVFLHISQFRDPDHLAYFSPGALVEYDLILEPKGPAAHNAEVLSDDGGILQ